MCLIIGAELIYEFQSNNTAMALSNHLRIGTNFYEMRLNIPSEVNLVENTLLVSLNILNASLVCTP